MGNKSYYVYILSNKTGTLYIGVTNDLQRRLNEHKQGLIEGFTQRYKIHKLLYFEETDNVYDALDREKQLKRWSRKKKLDLIRMLNPRFEDLAMEFFEE